MVTSFDFAAFCMTAVELRQKCFLRVSSFCNNFPFSSFLGITACIAAKALVAEVSRSSILAHIYLFFVIFMGWTISALKLD